MNLLLLGKLIIIVDEPGEDFVKLLVDQDVVELVGPVVLVFGVVDLDLQHSPAIFMLIW